LLAKFVEDAAQILAVDVFEGDEVAVVDFAEIEDLGDIRVLELHRDLRLVDEHRDELFVLSDAGQDALERHDAFEALDADGLRLEYLGHTSNIDTFEEVVLAEGNWFVQAASVRSVESTALAFPLSTTLAVQVKQALPGMMPIRQARQRRNPREQPRPSNLVVFSISLYVLS